VAAYKKKRPNGGNLQRKKTKKIGEEEAA